MNEIITEETINTFNKKTESCNAFKFTIYVEQPVPGTRKAYDKERGVGHAFIQLSCSKDTLTVGWYPKSGYMKSIRFLWNYNKDREGELRNDYGHDWNVKKTWTIRKKDTEKVKEFIRKWLEDNTKYNLAKRNCADFAIRCGLAAGRTELKDKGKSRWPWFFWVESSNPGALGEDLVKLGGVRRNTVR